MSKLISNLWFGSEESYYAVLDARDRVAVLVAAGSDAIKAAVIAAGGGRGEDPFGLPPLWQASGHVAVLNVEGSLVAGNAGFMRIFGITGYGDVQDALREIAADGNIKTVLMNIDSGGGQVDGVMDMGDSIRALDSMKPVVSYTGGTMGSAAYWMGSSAREVIAAPTAQVGSVGTLIVHTERSKARADAGFKDTVVRYGKYKALGNPLETLSEDGKAQLQMLADESGKIFVNYVSDRRNMTASDFQKKAGEGRVFMGQQAMDVGLVDKVASLSGALLHAKSLDKAGTQPQNRAQSRKGVNMKLSKLTVIAIAAGTALDQLGLAAPEANTEGVKLEGAALATAETEAKEVKAAIDTRVTAAVTQATTPLSAKVAELEAAKTVADTALKAATDKVALSEAAATQIKGQLDVSAALAAEQAEIVKASMSVMSVALGGAANVGAALTGSELLAEHKKLSEQFTKKFPTGGVAAVNIPADKTQATSAISPMLQHMIDQSKKVTQPATAK